MAAVVSRSRTKNVGLRPMDPMKDLHGVADLIEEAFASDLDRSGQSALRELRWLSYLGPVLWWMVYFSPDHSDFLSGFVWEEDRKIVGNITVNRTTVGSRRWLISNVAVAKDYRGRGIARSLMYAGLELVKEYHGLSVSLQVRADNAPARTLYDSLQFKEVSGTTYLRASRVPMVSPREEYPLPPGVILRPHRFDAADARQAYGLATAATPQAAQKEWPLRQSHFQLSDKERLGNFFRKLTGLRRRAYWVIEDGTRFVGLAKVSPGLLGEAHHLELTVHPDWRGSLEQPLISRALRYLAPWRSQTVMVKQSVDHMEAIEAYKEFGFQEDQTLIWMKLDM